MDGVCLIYKYNVLKKEHKNLQNVCPQTTILRVIVYRRVKQKFNERLQGILMQACSITSGKGDTENEKNTYCDRNRGSDNRNFDHRCGIY